MTVIVGDFDLDVEPHRASQPLASGSSALAGDIAERIGDRGELSASAVTEWKRDADARGRAELLAAPRAHTQRRRSPLVFVAGGAAAVLVIAVVAIVALRGGGGESKKSNRVSANDSSGASRTEDVPVAVDTRTSQPESGAGSQMRLDEKTRRANAAATGAGSSEGDATSDPPVEPAVPVAVETPTTPPTTAPATPPVTPAPPRRPATLGGKKVVLEYDNTAPKETPKKAPVPAKGDDSASVGTARITYFSGNRKLFAGDADGAIKLYKQALAMYPGYVAAYRGLGLAYAQKGDKSNALKAFRTYLSAVPGAKDVALVKKRIATLQR